MNNKVAICRVEHFNAAHRLHNPLWSDEKNKEETTVHVQYASGLLQNFFGAFSNTE